MNEIKCGCGYWLGEAAEPMAHVGHVEKGDDSAERVRVQPPRDLRVCKRCGRLNVYVPLSRLGISVG